MLTANRECAQKHWLFFERVDRGKLSELLAVFRENEPRGEYTVVIAGAAAEADPARAERAEKKRRYKELSLRGRGESDADGLTDPADEIEGD